jgi:hypothetical protein
MTINRTTLLDLPLPVTGTESGVWGDVTNNGLTQYLDIAIAGRNALTSANFTGGALTLATTEGDSSATNIAAGSAQYATLYVSSLAANSTITAPSSNRAYRVVNADATYTLTVKAAGQTGVVFPVNTSGTVVFNGTDYVLLGSYVIASAGTASLPSITFTGDTNTGIFSPAADTIAFAEGGVEAMRIDSSGNVGIGTTSPSNKLDVYRATGLARLRNQTGDASQVDWQFENSGGSGYLGLLSTGENFYDARGAIAAHTFQISGAEQMRLNSSGNLGLGVTPSAWGGGFKSLDLHSSNGASFASTGGSMQAGMNFYWDGSNYLYKGTGHATRYQQLGGGSGQNNHSWYFATSGTAGNAISFTQAMTLDDSGNLLVGTTTDTTGRINATQTGTTAVYFARNTNATGAGGYQLQYGTAFNNTGNEAFYFSDGTLRAAIRSNGGLANFSGNDVNLSDRREKTNFAPAKSYLETICAIPVQTFNYIDQNMEDDPGLTLGVVAQDVQAVAPELVMESNWGTKEEPKQRLSIYQTDLQYALMKALQELKAEVDTVKAELATLKGN